MGGKKGGQGNGATRHWLAITMVSLSVAGITVAAWVAIAFSNSTDRADTTRLVFTSVLPLFGTWVGTVLAFYFARENLQAATDSTLRLTRPTDAGTPVTQVMVPRLKITAFPLKSGDDADLVKLADLLKTMNDANVHRIPILTDSGAVVYVVHDSTIASYADSVTKNPNDASFTDTMADLTKKDDAYKTAIEAIGIVGPGAVLADARAAMQAVKGCNDVFVTTSGQKNDPVIGWLTNTDLAGVS